MRSKRKRHWLGRGYKAFVKKKEGKKIIEICRILSEKISTAQELRKALGYSSSEMYNLLELAEDHGWIVGYLTIKVSRRRGKPRVGEQEKKTGRPPRYYALTPKGLFYMRSDPVFRQKWKSVDEVYDEVHKPTILDSYRKLGYAIQNHPRLSEFRRPYYFDGELQRTLLNPLLFETSIAEEEFDILSDELVELIKENVESEHIKNYQSTLQSSYSRLQTIINRHNLLIDKIKSIENSNSQKSASQEL